MADVDRMAAALALDHRAVLDQRRHAARIQRRRHHQDAQILAQARLDVERERQPEIGLQRALVELIEDHAIDAFEIGRGQRHAGEHAFGHHFDPGFR